MVFFNVTDEKDPAMSHKAGRLDAPEKGTPIFLKPFDVRLPLPDQN
jgi:hypothetical protein